MVTGGPYSVHPYGLDPPMAWIHLWPGSTLRGPWPTFVWLATVPMARPHLCICNQSVHGLTFACATSVFMISGSSTRARWS